MRRNKKYIILFLLISLLWLFANQAMNSHAHILYDGQVIRHSHPYTPDKNSHSPFQSHKHSPSVAFFIDLISNVLIESLGTIPLLLALLVVLEIVRAALNKKLLYQFCASGSGRAPPAIG
jgi:hypothetical protein